MNGVRRRASLPAIPPRDRMWVGARSTRLYTGLQVPNPGALRATLRELAAMAPGHRIFGQPTPDGRRWSRVAPAALPDLCDRMVVVRPDGADDTYEAVGMELQNETADNPAFQFILGDDYIAVRTEHVVTDGTTLTRWFGELWDCALTGRSPHALAAGGTTGWPMARGLVHALREDPRRPLAAVADTRNRTPGPPAAPTRRRPWTPRTGVVTAIGQREALAEVRRWRARWAVGVSIVAVLFAAARQALEDEDIRPARRGMSVVIDNRRYLPPGTSIDGNFASGVFLEPGDPTSPAEVHRAMRGAVDHARSMATLALGAASEATGRRPPRATSAVVGVRPALTLTHLGRLEAFDPVPEAGRFRLPQVVCLTTQWRPEDLTLILSELRGTLQVSASFNSGMVDEDALRRAVAVLAAHPVGLLGEGRRRIV